MRSTKVKALSVGGRRKVYFSGDTVSEDMFPKGDFDKLIEKGFLHPVGEGSDDGKKPNFDQDDDQPETRYGADVKLQPQMPGMINPAFAAQPQVQAGPSKPKDPIEPPVVPGTPGHESVKVQNDETGKTQVDVEVKESEEQKATREQAEKAKKQQAEKAEQKPAAKTTDEKIKDITSAEKKAPSGSTNFDDVDSADGVTVAQMKKDLDARGVPYPSNAKKEDLLKLWARGE